MPPTGKYKEVYEAMLEKYGPEKGEEVFYAYCREKGIDPDAKTFIDAEPSQFTFSTDSLTSNVVETKAGKHYYVTGYISTPELDMQNDIVTPECLRDMTSQLAEKNVKLDVEHEAFLNDTTKVPIGRIVEAKMDKKGVWVKAELNPHSTRFDEVWNSLKNRFLDAFSITFKPLKFVEREMNGVKARLLYAVELLNVALTGNPAQENARIMEVFTKSVGTADEKSFLDIEQYDTDYLEDVLGGRRTAYIGGETRERIRREVQRRKAKKSTDGDNMAELKQSESDKDKEKEKEEEDEEKRKAKKSASETPKVAVVEKNEIKSLSDAIAELKTELSSMKSMMDEMKKGAEVETLATEVKSLTAQVKEVNAKVDKKPVFKAIDTSSVEEKRAEKQAIATGRGVLSLI